MQFASVFCVLVCALLAEVTFGQMDCTGKPDGVHGYGCKSYTECTSGKGKLVDCQQDEAFNYETKQCEPVDQVPAPCGKIEHNCDVQKTGRFAIQPDCKWFYTCSEGHFLGASPCNGDPNGPLVFDEKDQLCNWKHDVLPPCGTKEE